MMAADVLRAAPRILSALLALGVHPHVRRARLETFRAARLRRLVAHACAHVPFYRRLFRQAGVDPREIRHPQDLARLPITTRAQLQQTPLAERLCEKTARRSLIRRRTSGSSGRPLDILRSAPEERLLQAFRWRARMHTGRRVGDRIASIAHPGTVDAPRFPRLRRFAAAAGLQRQQLISCFEPLEQQAAALQRQRPQILNGFASSIWRLACYLDQRPHGLRPRCIHTGGDVLRPAMRGVIERVFGVPVLDYYGSHECNLLAWQCAQTSSYHVCDDSLILEVLRDGEPVAEGEVGEVVVTSLHSYTMPFVRYQLGDLVRKGGRCGCGQPFDTIGEIVGRMNDGFALPDGRWLHPYRFTEILVPDPRSPILQFQLVQQRKDLVRAQVVLVRGASAASLEPTRSKLQAMLGPQVRLELAVVPQIEVEASGKFRMLRSLVSSAYREPADEA